MAFVCVDGGGRRIAPCGRCRQLLAEHAHPDMLLAMPCGFLGMRDVLPHSFGPAALAAFGPAGGPVGATRGEG